jgi:hypothetical protein
MLVRTAVPCQAHHKKRFSEPQQLQGIGPAEINRRLPQETGSSEPEQASGVATKNFSSSLRLNLRAVTTVTGRSWPIKAKVASKHDAVGSNEVYEIAQRLRSVADGIVGEASEIT